MENLAPEKNAILSDPAGCLSEIHRDANTGDIAELSRLDSLYRDLKQQYKCISETTKSLSREIGEARRNNLPTDNLLARMREQSARLKETANRLSATEETILGYFNFTDAIAEPDKSHLVQDKDLPNRQHVNADGYNGHVSISLLGTNADDWNDYVIANQDASIYHRAEWKELIHETFGHDTYYFMARDSSGKVRGVLPLIHINSRLFGNILVSMPYFNYGGAIADHPSIELELMNRANAQAVSLAADYVEYRDDVYREGLPVSTRKVNMLLALPDSGDALWQGFSSKLRAQIRRPQKENPEVRFGGVECLDDFYEVFSRNMRDLGTPVYGKEFFRNILEKFPGRCRIVVVMLRSQPVAAGFLTGHNETLEIPWASTLRQVNHLSMNMQLYWSVLNFAIDQHYKLFDFGRCSRDSGTYRFKQQWGAQPRQLYWHYWLKQGAALPSLNPGNPKYAMAIGAWRRLPLWTTKWLGPRIVKYIP